MKKNILFTGGTGFIGSTLSNFLYSKSFNIYLYTQNIKAANQTCKIISTIEDLRKIPPLDGVINLAGAPIAGKRWSEKYKKTLYESRVHKTINLINALKNFQNIPKFFISASAVGYYLDQDDTCSEEFPLRVVKNFSNKLCQEWENAAQTIAKNNVRVCLMRLGAVIGKDGGILKKAELPFKFGLGTIFSDGKQFMPWIHLDDCINAFLHVIENQELNGAFNLVSPNACSNLEFSNLLAKQFNKKPFMHLPASIVRALFGKVAEETMLKSILVKPDRLLKSGFNFQYRDMNSALKSCYG